MTSSTTATRGWGGLENIRSFFTGRDTIKPNQSISENTHGPIKCPGKDATLIKGGKCRGMCEEGAVKKRRVPINSARQMPSLPPPPIMAPTCSSIRLQKSLKEISQSVEAAEAGPEPLAHTSPLPILCVSPAQSLLCHTSLRLTAPEEVFLPEACRPDRPGRHKEGGESGSGGSEDHCFHAGVF